MANEVSERRWLWIIFVLYFLLAVGYSLLMPIWEAPDEPAHYHLAWRLARKGEYATDELNYEASQPRAFYYFGSLVIRALDKVDTKFSDYFFPREYKYNIRVAERRFDWNDSNYRFLLGVYALRWVNLLFGALALWLNWKTFKLITPDKPTLQLSALALAGLTPQYLHIMSSVNNDALGTLAGALLFYLVIRAANGSNNLINILFVPLAIILPFLTKLTVLPVGAALLLVIAWKWFSSVRHRRWLAVSAIILLSGAGVLYFFFPEMIQTAWGEIKWRLFSFHKRASTLKYLTTVSSQIVWTYWGKVGWIAVGLSWWVVDLLTLAGFIGIAIQVKTITSSLRGRSLKQSPTRPANAQLWIATLLIALFTILAVARNALTTGATQGRFLFPAIGALSLLMVGGWYDVLPERAQQKFPRILVSLMFVLNIALCVFEVIPVYYQPFFD